MEVKRFTVPLDSSTSTTLTSLWGDIFGGGYDPLPGLYAGEEIHCNDDTIFACIEGSSIIGTLHMTISRKTPSLAGFGEVATLPEYRGRGIATSLLDVAIGCFESKDGRALFLGSGNPAAQRVYERVGFLRLQNSNIFARILSDMPADDFYSEYFEPCGAGEVLAGSPSERIDMIPLLAFPSPSPILDCNLNLFSTTYTHQPSCMGLYPKYESLRQRGGEFFALRNDKGRLVGLATAVMVDDACWIDGFTHPSFSDGLPTLLRAAMDWGTGKTVRYRTKFPVDDSFKQTVFSQLGFRPISADILEWCSEYFCAGR